MRGNFSSFLKIRDEERVSQKYVVYVYNLMYMFCMCKCIFDGETCLMQILDNCIRQICASKLNMVVTHTKM